MLAGVSGGRGVLERDLDMSGVRLGLRSARIFIRGRQGDLKYIDSFHYSDTF